MSTNTLDETKAKIQTLSSRIAELESVNLGLQQKLSEYSQKLEDDRFSHRTQVPQISHCNYKYLLRERSLGWRKGQGDQQAAG